MKTVEILESITAHGILVRELEVEDTTDIQTLVRERLNFAEILSPEPIKFESLVNIASNLLSAWPKLIGPHLRHDRTSIYGILRCNCEDCLEFRYLSRFDGVPWCQ